MDAITLRLDDEILQRIDDGKGKETRSEYIRKLLVLALDHQGEHKETTTEYGENTVLVEALKADIEHLRSQNVDLTKLLNQEQSLHLQTQRQLIPAQDERKKKWWEVWKWF